MIPAGFHLMFRTALYSLVLSFFFFTTVQAQPELPARDPAAAIAMIRLLSAAPLTGAVKALDKEALQRFYAQRGYGLAWDRESAGQGDKSRGNEGGGNEGLAPKAAAVYAVLASADVEGLDPADYHVNEIARLANALGARDRVDRDFLITDGILRYAADVSSGKLSPGQTDERTSPTEWLDCPLYLAAAVLLPPGQLADVLATLPPSTPEYRALRNRLADLRRLAQTGGWSSLPDGPTLHPGQHDEVVPALRQRLIAEGRIAPPSHPLKSEIADIYDSGLSGAVAIFQGQHGIKPDGVIGKDTRAALDEPVDERIRQAIVNMERARWEDIPTTGRMVEVNLAAYSLTVYQDGAPILAMPVVVGTPENQTPIISSRITTVVVNPNWTLPPNVIREMLPRIHSDGSYLAGKGIGRFENDGRVRLVQPPGPSNPLGHYKFVMPNDQDIYLHDSPDAAKFHYTLRAYSHGCVRLGKPADLAALLLDDRIPTLHTSLPDLAATWETHYITLSKPVSVSLVYRTAWLDNNAQLVLGEDSYGRDQKLWKALRKSRVGPPPTKRIAVRSSQARVL
jgi:murein L,D-transpeptidase YcbB/YkuD